jgi:hypothetical protein
VFFRAWREGKAVPRPAHSAALVTALQIFRRAMRGTTFMARVSILSFMRPRSGKSCQKKHPAFHQERMIFAPLSLTR